MPKDNETVKPGLKVVAIAASAVLVAALAATGVLAYGQNNTGSNMTDLEGQANATDTASANNMTETTTNSSSNATDDDTSEQERDDEPTFTASASADSECAPVITTDDGAAASNATTSFIGTLSEDEIETMTAGLNDTQAATLDALIKNACDAIRDGKSVTALGFLSTAQDVLNGAETETAEAESEDEVEDEDESGDIDAADEEDDDAEDEN